jgi:multidrug efflux pump subunit AcrA (membrane-fusion protein)/rubrerythrin
MQNLLKPQGNLALFCFCILFLSSVAVAGEPAVFTNTPPAAGAPGKTLYSCGMHPQVIQDHPGNCPICGMRLTPLVRNATTDRAITVDSTFRQNMGLRTMVVTNAPLRRTLRTVGNVTLDETSVVDVTTKYRGWLEKIYVDTVGARVHRGDPLFEIYSPDLYSAQAELLIALAHKDETLIPLSRQKLSFWDVDEDQIAEIEREGKPIKALRIGAPADGFVMEKNAVVGSMVEAGARIYQLADMSLVWIQAQVYEQDLPFVKLGQEALVRLDYLPDRVYHVRITYIYPILDEKTRTARVRMEVHNPGYFLKPGMFATVEWTSELSPSVLLVPDMAVLRSGTRATVFVATDDAGHFEPRNVMLGVQGADGMLEVREGLHAGERVVVSGQFMLDSESQLREAYLKMTPLTSPAPATGTNTVSVVMNKTTNDTLAYVCPMPEHVSIVYHQPGQCPLCHMTLVPVDPDMLRHVQSAEKIMWYTCPMPEHAQVHEEKPGKCPLCRMTLIPVMSGDLVVTNAMPAMSRSANATTTSGVTHVILYTCPMPEHANVVTNRPGTCPECGMALVDTRTVAHGAKAEALWQQTHPTPAEKK